MITGEIIQNFDDGLTGKDHEIFGRIQALRALTTNQEIQKELDDFLDLCRRQNTKIKQYETDKEEYIRDYEELENKCACIEEERKFERQTVTYLRAEIEKLQKIISVMEEQLKMARSITIKEYQHRKCGNCAYSIPIVWGKSKVYVKCTNQEHIQRFCQRKNSLERPRTTPACQSWEMKEG